MTSTSDFIKDMDAVQLEYVQECINSRRKHLSDQERVMLYGVELGRGGCEKWVRTPLEAATFLEEQISKMDVEYLEHNLVKHRGNISVVKMYLDEDEVEDMLGYGEDL